MLPRPDPADRGQAHLLFPRTDVLAQLAALALARTASARPDAPPAGPELERALERALLETLAELCTADEERASALARLAAALGDAPADVRPPGSSEGAWDVPRRRGRRETRGP